MQITPHQKSQEGSRRYSPAPYDLATSDPTYFSSAEPRSFSEMMVSKLHVYMCHNPENITLHHILHHPLSVTLLGDIIKMGTCGA